MGHPINPPISTAAKAINFIHEFLQADEMSNPTFLGLQTD